VTDDAVTLWRWVCQDDLLQEVVSERDEDGDGMVYEVVTETWDWVCD